MLAKINTALLILTAAAIAAPAVAADFSLPGACEVHLVDDLELHATEAGILDYVAVKEGARVRTEDVLVKIDTSEPVKMKEIAKYKLNAAVERAKDDIEERYAVAAANASQAEVLEMEETNRRVPKSVTEADLRKARLDYERARLQIDKAQHDRKLAELDAWSLKAEYEAADMAIERRTLRAPFNGVVVEQFRNEKEWVNPGDPILRLIRMDQLQVEGLVPIEQHAPAELTGCEVTVAVPVGGGRVVQATGRIVFVNLILLRGQKALVRAEVTNREENGEWLILPNMTAKMTIHLGTGGVAASRPGPARMSGAK